MFVLRLAICRVTSELSRRGVLTALKIHRKPNGTKVHLRTRTMIVIRLAKSNVGSYWNDDHDCEPIEQISNGP